MNEGDREGEGGIREKARGVKEGGHWREKVDKS